MSSPSSSSMSSMSSSSMSSSSSSESSSSSSASPVTEVTEAITGIWGTVRRVNLTMTRGDSKTYVLTVQDSNGNRVRLTGAKLWFTIKEYITDTDAEAQLQISTDDASEILITSGGDGEAEIYFLPGDTSGLAIKNYYYDIQLKMASGAIATIMQGGFNISRDITLSIT